MALRAGYYGVKRFLRDKLEMIAGTYDETIQSLFPRSEQEVLGAKNLLPNNATSITAQGIEYTVNSDKTITVDGKSTTNPGSYLTIGWDYYPAGTYIVSGNPLNNAIAVLVIRSSNDGTNWSFMDAQSGGVDKVITLSEAKYLKFEILVYQDKQIDNTIIAPMMRLGTNTDPTYVPYAMTNKELTDKVQGIIDAATNAADFAAFKSAMGAIKPVTRSLSLTKEDITEEVKEDVEPEKTVTKKRTTKKTEEV